MRAVIYDAEGFEPLTVIDVPQQFMREIEQGIRPPRLRFPTTPSNAAVVRKPIADPTRLKIVTVSFEPIYKGRKLLMWLCTTTDAESALLLRAAFLPGQRGEVNRQLEAAFLDGLFAAMS